MEVTIKKLVTLMNIEKIKKCDECIYNYKNIHNNSFYNNTSNILI